MKKSLRNTLIVLVAIVVVAYFGLTFFLGSVVRAGVNHFGPQILVAKVELKGASLSPLTGSGTLTGLTVGNPNPKEWGDANAFSLGKVHLAMKPFSIFGDHIVIDEIDIENPEFFYETHLYKSNVGDLLKNVESATGNNSAEAKTKSGKPLKFEVKHFHLAGGKVKVGVGAAAVTLPLPPIDLTDLGTKEGGITSGQLAFAIMRSVTSDIASTVTSAAGKLGGSMGGAATDALKSLFGGKK